MRDSTLSPLRYWLPTLLVGLAAVFVAGCGGPNLFERVGTPYWGICGTLVIVLDIVALVDIIGDDGRDSTSKVIWSLLVIFFPVGGLILYYLFGK